MNWRNGLKVFSAAVFISLSSLAAFAQQPQSGGIDFQPAATPIMHDIHSFHTGLLLPIITAVVLVVLGLLLWCMVRYNAKANPTPSRFAHNTLIEVIWTVVPVLILVVIAIPSFRILYRQHTTPTADLTVKATGYSWYWNYTYPDQGGFAFDSRMLEDKDRADPVSQPRLLAVDNEMVVPAGKVVRMLVTADPQGVIHSFAVPSFGLKVDAIPGRLNEIWFQAEHSGMYYGQCSELCGINHSFMPIAVRAVSEPEFARWVEQAKKRYARTDGPTQTAGLR